MMKCDFLYDGEWGGIYDPITKTMTAGYSMDGITFSPEFIISELEEECVETAIAICSSLYCYYGIIFASFDGLKQLRKDVKIIEEKIS